MFTMWGAGLPWMGGTTDSMMDHRCRHWPTDIRWTSATVAPRQLLQPSAVNAAAFAAALMFGCTAHFGAGVYPHHYQNIQDTYRPTQSLFFARTMGVVTRRPPACTLPLTSSLASLKTILQPGCPGIRCHRHFCPMYPMFTNENSIDVAVVCDLSLDRWHRRHRSPLEGRCFCTAVHCSGPEEKLAVPCSTLQRSAPRDTATVMSNCIGVS